jgi:hypothetical protein
MATAGRIKSNAGTIVAETMASEENPPVARKVGAVLVLVPEPKVEALPVTPIWVVPVEEKATHALVSTFVSAPTRLVRAATTADESRTEMEAMPLALICTLDWVELTVVGVPLPDCSKLSPFHVVLYIASTPAALRVDR